MLSVADNMNLSSVERQKEPDWRVATSNPTLGGKDHVDVQISYTMTIVVIGSPCVEPNRFGVDTRIVLPNCHRRCRWSIKLSNMLCLLPHWTTD